MSYIVKQPIKGKIYLYKVESYWDKNKKQPRQKRTYLGPENKTEKTVIKSKVTNIVSKNYGNIFFFEKIIQKIGLDTIIKNCYPDIYNEIFALIYYEIMEGNPSYLFPYWLEEQNLSNVKKLHSSDISELYDYIGRNQIERDRFTKLWIKHLNPIQGVYYDITSVSSYSTKIDNIEWGYNRDKEYLPQLNIGLVCCQNTGLPFFYNILQGSIVDVTTIKNFIKYLKAYKLKDILLIMDRGFFSTHNILEISDKKNKIKFIQPLSFTLKKVKDLIKTHKKELSNPQTAFKYNQEILHHVLSKISFENQIFDAHIFYNEKSELDQRHHLLSDLLEIETKHKDKKFNTLKEFQKFKKEQIPDKFRKLFKWNKTNLYFEKNIKTLNEYISNLGYFVMASNSENMDCSKVLTYYRDKDKIEKIFDILKNEMDGARIRSHSQNNADGKIFVKYLTLILYMEISRTMKDKKLFEKYTIQELIRELKKIKISYIDDQQKIISEISKKQKLIFQAFDMEFTESS